VLSGTLNHQPPPFSGVFSSWTRVSHFRRVPVVGCFLQPVPGKNLEGQLHGCFCKPIAQTVVSKYCKKLKTITPVSQNYPSFLDQPPERWGWSIAALEPAVQGIRQVADGSVRYMLGIIMCAHSSHHGVHDMKASCLDTLCLGDADYKSFGWLGMLVDCMHLWCVDTVVSYIGSKLLIVIVCTSYLMKHYRTSCEADIVLNYSSVCENSRVIICCLFFSLRA